MMAGIYCSDIFCDECIEDIKETIWLNNSETLDELRNEWEEREGFDDETHYDSGEYPKHCRDDEESDCPQHCGNGSDCLNAEEYIDGEKCGYFFENALTSVGSDYVREEVREDLEGGCESVATKLWMPFYDYIDYGVTCVECGGDECGVDECSVTLICNGCGEDFKPDDLNDDNYCVDCVEKLEPEDFTITPCGILGEQSALGRVEGKFIGPFGCIEDAVTAAKVIMEKEQFWPNIWIASDHGNWDLV